VRARTALGDIEREVSKAESDVQLVRERAARNRSRLDAGTGSAKDLQALQHELDSLGRRQARRLTLTPAWQVNRHVLFNVNYTWLDVTGPQAGGTRTFFVTPTVTS
jgi:hypothetical protein